MSGFVFVTVKHITAAINHPAKHTNTHTHTQNVCVRKRSTFQSSHQFVGEGIHVSGSPLT